MATQPACQYVIRIRGRLGATALSAFPAMGSEVGKDETLLTGFLVDRSALYGVIAQIEALGLELIEVRQDRPAKRAEGTYQQMTRQQQLELDATLRQGQIDTAADVPTLRAAFSELMARVPLAPDVQQQATVIGGVPGIEVTLESAKRDGLLLYFHGGVYVIGSAATSVALVSDLVRRSGVKAITVDYRLGPEHPYPAAVDDARAVYEGLLAAGYDPDRIVLAGESAGGGLAVATLLALREAGLPQPAGALLMSPYADLTLSGETLSLKEPVDALLSPAGLRARINDYVAGADAADPLISPVFGDLHGLPPLLIQVGSHEILLSDALRLAGRAAVADVPVTLDVTPGVPHVFQSFAAVLDEGSAALDRAAAFVSARLA